MNARDVGKAASQGNSARSNWSGGNARSTSSAVVNAADTSARISGLMTARPSVVASSSRAEDQANQSGLLVRTSMSTLLSTRTCFMRRSWSSP